MLDTYTKWRLALENASFLVVDLDAQLLHDLTLLVGSEQGWEQVFEFILDFEGILFQRHLCGCDVGDAARRAWDESMPLLLEGRELPRNRIGLLNISRSEYNILSAWNGLLLLS